MDNLINKRRLMMAAVQGGVSPVPLPYDAQIEYIGTSGSQYINTGIKPSVDKETEIILTLARTSSSTNEGFGANANLNYVKASSTTTKWRLNGVTVNKVITNGEIVTITLKQTSSGRYYELDSFSGYGSSNQTSNNFMFGTLGGTPSYKFNGRLYSLKIKENDELVLDLIPVRIGQVGYMYNKVDGEFFANAGTGNFILGNDIKIKI